jgi:hypothetical protein
VRHSLPHSSDARTPHSWPGGLLIFDFLEPGQVRPRQVLKRQALEEDWAVLVQSEEDDEGRLSRRITSFRKAGELYRRTDETHTIQLFTAPQLRDSLTNAGFASRLLRGYGAFRLSRRHAVLVARKPPKNELIRDRPKECYRSQSAAWAMLTRMVYVEFTHFQAGLLAEG